MHQVGSKKEVDAFRFSVVTAAYNAAPWIDAMLESLVGQTLDFPSHIQVVVVDDGSTDGTAEAVERWVARYPGNIVLVRQKNAGPAAARNRGLDEARGEWLSFIDADDFVSSSYFQEIDAFLDRSGFTGPIVACNLLLFNEQGGIVHNSHGLAYKFETTRIVNLLELPEFIQLSASSCVLRHSALRQSGLRFDLRIRPSFEDAHLLNTLLLSVRDFNMAFIKTAQYFYRRRGGMTGLVEGGWSSPAKYLDQMLFGYLDLLQHYHRALGHVPAFVQNIVLYECHWYMKRLLEGVLPCPLTQAQQDEFFKVAALVFQYIDMRQILLSGLPVLEIHTRIAMLHAFKDVRFSGLPFVVTELAPGGDAAHLLHVSTDRSHYGLHDGVRAVPVAWEKRIDRQFGNRSLCQEYRCWVPLRAGEAIWPEVDGTRPGVICRESALETLEKEAVRQQFYLSPDRLVPQRREEMAWAFREESDKQGWVLMDRVGKADDNAEHLCRWLLQRHPELVVHFVLDQRSGDWERLRREGFPLLAYGSDEHHGALASAQWLVSSHVDPPVIDPMQTRTLCGVPTYKTAFLQHGIILADLSAWLNDIPLDCIVTSTRPEYASLLAGTYKFTEREVVLAGLPRHDALLRKAKARKPGRVILLCPTWHEYSMRTALHGLGPAQVAQVFRQSDVYRAWNGVVGSQRLAQLLGDHGYRMLFLPHPKAERFLPLFQPSAACMLLRWSEVKSVQDLLVSCAMAVTDHSSIVLDLAFIGRPVAYFQFEQTPSGSSLQARKPNYFDQERDGMGPVLRTIEALEGWLAEMLGQHCRRADLYEERAAAFYPLRDGQNCRRVYEAIMERSTNRIPGTPVGVDR